MTYDVMMIPISSERAHWLARNILPHEGHLRAWLGGRRFSGIEIDDIVQETYAKLAALESVSHIRNPKNYMFQTARSLVLQYFRRAQLVSIEAFSEVDMMEVPSFSATPERQVSDRQELRRIAELIANLPEKCREVVILRKVHGLSQREIALKLGISENTVEKHIVKGLRILMSSFDQGRKISTQASKEQVVGENQVHGGTGKKLGD